MKIDLNNKIKTLEGEPVLEKDEPVTFAHPCINALLSNHPDETVSGEEKLRRYQLAKRISDTLGAVTLTIEEAALIKTLVPKLYTPLVVGQLYELMEA